MEDYKEIIDLLNRCDYLFDLVTSSCFVVMPNNGDCITSACIERVVELTGFTFNSVGLSLDGRVRAVFFKEQ